MGIVAVVVAIIVATAILGWLGREAARHGAEAKLWAGLYAVVSTSALAVLLFGNYMLAKTGLDRLIGGKEMYRITPGGKDIIGTFLLGGDTMISPYFALALTLASVAAAGKLHRLLRRMFQMWRDSAHVSHYVWTSIGITVCILVLAMDSYILSLRIATMLNPNLMESGLGQLPGLFQLASGGNAGAEVLRVIAIAYPCVIAVVESKASTAWANFFEETRGFAAPAVPETPAQEVEIDPDAARLLELPDDVEEANGFVQEIPRN